MSKDKGKKEKKKKKKEKIKLEGFAPLEAVLILAIVGIVGFASWYVYHSKNNANNSYNNASSIDNAAKNSPKKTTTTKTTTTTTTTKPAISDSLKENTAASIESQNTAALEGYMTGSVTVVIAASEKGGSETAVQAIKDLDYLNSGTSPWDFNLDSATLTSYKNGSYGKYFDTDSTIVGKSANNYVVSFGVNAAGKIDTVFMAASSDLLTQ